MAGGVASREIGEASRARLNFGFVARHREREAGEGFVGSDSVEAGCVFQGFLAGCFGDQEYLGRSPAA